MADWVKASDWEHSGGRPQEKKMHIEPRQKLDTHPA